MNRSTTVFLSFVFSIFCFNMQAMNDDVKIAQTELTVKQNIKTVQLASCASTSDENTPNRSPDIGAVFPISPSPESSCISYRYHPSPDDQSMHEQLPAERFPLGISNQNEPIPLEQILATKRAQTVTKQIENPDLLQRIKMANAVLKNERDLEKAHKKARNKLPKNSMQDRAKFLCSSRYVQSLTPCSLACCCPCYTIGAILACPCITGYICCHCQSDPCDECCPTFADNA
ncbi:MAG: hypothetical protein P4L31_06400, partial [Candidatus Babeliales bacterium]|nr:hypothetical protein [Candidatus Babeliales bacterium]